TTTEIIDVLSATDTPSVLITAVGQGPAAQHASAEVVLDFADETSVVQTRFATTTLVLLRASLGEDLSAAIADAEAVLSAEPEAALIAADQVTFLGTGWAKGLADEAALKLREATQSWTEAYYAMEYRHGPIAIAEPGRVVSVFGPAPEGLSAQVEATGATWHAPGLDPLAQLVGAHLWAGRRAVRPGSGRPTAPHPRRPPRVVPAPLPAGAASAAAPRRAIGIDVGGARTMSGLVAADGSLGIPYSLPTPADPRELCAMLARE